MVNNKGQALVEFVLVLPIIIILIFGMIELGNMIHKKYDLENHMNTIVELYKADKEDVIESYDKTNNLTSTFDEKGSVVTVTLSEKVAVITPGISTFIDNPYTLKVKRSFYKDEATASE